jgi:hypothetical protein
MQASALLTDFGVPKSIATDQGMARIGKIFHIYVFFLTFIDCKIKTLAPWKY